MVELTTKTIEYVDYFDMRDHIEEKYKIKERDYKDHFGFDYIAAYMRHGLTKEVAEQLYKTPPAKMWPEHRAINADIQQESLQWSKDHPYCDFWHFMLDYWDEFDKGKPMHLNWQYVLDFAEEDWQKEIVQMYLNEFGDKDYTVIVDW